MSQIRLRAVPPLLSLLGLIASLPLSAASLSRFDPARPPSPQAGPEAVRGTAQQITRVQIHAADGRRYQLWVAALGAPPRSGYPVMYLLDGHAAIQSLLSAPATARPTGPVLLVAVGAPGAAYFDVEGRAYDYTPPSEDGRPIFDPRVPSRRGGGAEAFLATLQGPVQSAVAARWPLDARHRGLWGHSYGGLFALYVLLRHGAAFQYYAPTSPSLWWHAPLPRRLAETFTAGDPGASACVRLSNGSAEGRPGQHPDRSAAHGALPGAGTSAGAPFADGDLYRQLEPVFGRRLHWTVYPGLSHGETLSASLGPAIRDFSAWSSGAATCDSLQDK